MLIPMILEVLARDLEQGAALLHPLRRPPSVADHETPDVPNPFALGNNSGLREDLAAQLENDCTSHQPSARFEAGNPAFNRGGVCGPSAGTPCWARTN